MTRDYLRRVHGRNVAFLVVLGLIITMTTGVVTARPASAEVKSDFYTPPTPLPDGTNGSIIRSEATELWLGLGNLPYESRRIMYRTTDHRGRPVAATGTVIIPQLPWTRGGQRPLLAFQPGTQGLGDQCAPSRQLANGVEYESLQALPLLLATGYAMVIPDYIGLGTPGVHSYLNRFAEGHAVLDAIRAAQRLPGTGLTQAGPVVMYGYSQGGHATASAAELAATYAPELGIRGAALGAPVGDLISLAKHVDGGIWPIFPEMVMSALQANYPELHVEKYLNARGRQVIHQVRDECVEDFASHSFQSYKTMTTSGETFADLWSTSPLQSTISSLNLGTIKPSFPVLVMQSKADEIVPHASTASLVTRWCGRGGNVLFKELVVPEHIATTVQAVPTALPWLQGLLAGRVPASNCGQL